VTKPSETPVRFLGRKEVENKVGVSYPTIWDWMRKGRFPRSRKIGDQKVSWLESEVDDWMISRPKVRLKGDPESNSGEAA
jgi:predicted DNA-binding transcriptional regulator AlpA